MRASILVVCCCIGFAPLAMARGSNRVARLLARMTLDEKVGQLTQCLAETSAFVPGASGNCRDEVARGRAGSVMNAFGIRATADFQKLAVTKTRLKIPLLFAGEIVHGYRTMFPIPLGESSSWDLELIQSTARATAREAAAEGLHWTYAPMVEVTRDPRWGRVMEGAGEDPWLGARIASARVRGFQGSMPSDGEHLLATAKHFLVTSGPVAGREYAGSIAGPRLRRLLMEPFEATVRAGVAAFMAGFGEVDGLPGVADRELLTDVLRRQWRFAGPVVSDYGAIPELVRHGVAEDNRRAGRLAFAAGVDVDLQGGAYGATLARDVRAGRVPPSALDRSVTRVLELKHQMGLLERRLTFTDDDAARAPDVAAPEHRALAREAAVRSIVLLKNDGTLPLKREGKIAVIGPLADSKRDALGPASPKADARDAVTLLEALREALRDRGEVVFAKGANLVDDAELVDKLNAARAEIERDPRSSRALVDEAVAVARAADVIVLALGESSAMSGEAASRTRLRLPINQQDLLVALHRVGKPIVLVVHNGRPLALELEDELSAAVVEGWYLGHEGGHALADVLLGVRNPAGRLTMSFPRHEGQVPLHYAELPSGRPFAPRDRFTSRYLDAPNEPLYPFGFGLGYSAFEYGPIVLSKSKMGRGDRLRVAVSVTNVGTREGEEVVQLYLRDDVAAVARPVKELRGFERVALKPQRSRKVTFELGLADLEYWDRNLRRRSDPGTFRIMIGGNSRDLHEASFSLK